MIVPIKFRGKDINGHFVYGLLTKKKIRSSGEIRWAIATGNCTLAETVPVSANSIAQFTGYSKDGREIYDGDIVVDGYGNEYTAQIAAVFSDAEESKKFLDNHKLNFTLKD